MINVANIKMRICPQSLAQYVDYFIMFNTNIYLSNRQLLYRKLSREEKRRQRRASAKYRLAHATRERMRVEVIPSNLAPSCLIYNKV